MLIGAVISHIAEGIDFYDILVKESDQCIWINLYLTDMFTLLLILSLASIIYAIIFIRKTVKKHDGDILMKSYLEQKKKWEKIKKWNKKCI